jgi:hypothetical protein
MAGLDWPMMVQGSNFNGGQFVGFFILCVCVCVYVCVCVCVCVCITNEFM